MGTKCIECGCEEDEHSPALKLCPVIPIGGTVGTRWVPSAVKPVANWGGFGAYPDNKTGMSDGYVCKDAKPKTTATHGHNCSKCKNYNEYAFHDASISPFVCYGCSMRG